MRNAGVSKSFDTYRVPRCVAGGSRVFQLTCAFSLQLLLASGALAGEAGGLTGREIAQQLNARDDGETLSQSVAMELIDRRGKVRQRRIRSFRKYYGEDKRMVIFFEAPKNIKGTAFLTYDYAGTSREDDQWLYLPALHKVRRISASDRGDYFLGTDFTFEDVKKAGKVEIDDYTFDRAGEEVVDGRRCHVVDAVPVSEKVAGELGYGRVRLWVDAQIWMARKTEMWDVRGHSLKTVVTKEIREVQGIWTAHRVEATHHKTGHRSLFTVTEVDYQNPISDDVFTELALRRGP